MRNVGPGPPRVFLRQPDPRGLSEEPRTASPVSCHPAPYISCCCPHRALTHWGTPPQHTLSQREVQASPPPIHMHTATVSIAAAPPSRRGGPSLSWFPATSSFRQGPTVADLAACDGRQGSLACGGQRLKMAPVVGLEAGGGGGRSRVWAPSSSRGPRDEEEQMGSNILPSSRRTVFTEYLLCVRHRAKHLFNPLDSI